MGVEPAIKAKKQSVLPKRPWPYRAAKKLRGRLDHWLARYSLISNESRIDPSSFAWTDELSAHWREIRAEAEALMPRLDTVPPLRSVSPDHRRIARTDLWRSFFLWGYGYRVEPNIACCPRTAALVAKIPDLNSAFFSILLPGMHIRPHRGPTKALVTCHLGLMVPEGETCRMSLAGEDHCWREGEWLVFDDTYRHEVLHEGSTPRVILLIQVKRPLRSPGRQIADLFLAGIRRSPFVQEGRRNMAAWEQGMKDADTPA